MMKARQVVALLCVAMGLYFVFIGQRAFYLLNQHSWSLKVLALAILVFPLVGVWVTVAEIRFGFATQRLGRRLTEDAMFDTDGASLAVDELPRLSSGRVEKNAAQEYFERCRISTERDSENWGRWFVLSQAYDMCGDRKRAREAMRHAVRLEAGKPAAA